MLYKNCEKGKSNWASNIKSLLSKFGFNNIWRNQGTQNYNLFLYNFELRLKDCEKQDWKTSITRSPKLTYYCMYKIYFECEQYLYSNLPRKVKKQYARFRLSNHNLLIEKGRHENIVREDRLCTFCGKSANLNKIECEFHFCLECQLYDNVRNQYPNISFEKTLFNFVKLMSSKDEQHINDFAWFLWKCFTVRRTYIEN